MVKPLDLGTISKDWEARLVGLLTVDKASTHEEATEDYWMVDSMGGNAAAGSTGGNVADGSTGGDVADDRIANDPIDRPDLEIYGCKCTSLRIRSSKHGRAWTRGRGECWERGYYGFQGTVSHDDNATNLEHGYCFQSPSQV